MHHSLDLVIYNVLFQVWNDILIKSVFFVLIDNYFDFNYISLLIWWHVIFTKVWFRIKAGYITHYKSWHFIAFYSIENLLGRLILPPKASVTSESGNTAFGTDSGTGEDDNVSCLLKMLSERGQIRRWHSQCKRLRNRIEKISRFCWRIKF